MIIEAGEVFTGKIAHSPGWIQLDGERITAVGEGPGPATPDLSFMDDRIVPGYVDVHSHGGGGSSFSTTLDDDIDRVLATHLATGTTTMIASLVTASPQVLRAQIETLATHVRSGDIAGIHLEGPWLSPIYKGAHDPALLCAPAIPLLDELVSAGQGAIKMVTIAPELDGGIEAIRFLTERGIVVALGHTDCSYDQARDALSAGATGATHLFNAMAPLRHRQPGPVLALLRDQDARIEIIFDGVHLHPDLAASVLQQVGDRGVLVTDAMAATGQPDGRYLLGELEVNVDQGIARLAGTDTIAGSTLRLESAVKNAVEAGLSVHDAIHAATTAPAEYLNLPDVGHLKPGSLADLLVLDDELTVECVMRRGHWV